MQKWQTGKRVLAGMALGLMLAGGAAAQGLRPTPVAWYTDNGDRQALEDLRALPETGLTEVERALLTAANRVGWIRLPGCERQSNAILIRVGARDAVVTSRHLIAGKWRGDKICQSDEEAIFFMNFSYLAGFSDSGLAVDDLYARITLEPNPLNFAPQGLFMEPAEDWLVYFLTETISDKPMPAGSFGAGQPRGAMRFSTRRPPGGQTYVIGYDGRFEQENGWQFSWQLCPFVQGRIGQPGVICFGCDASPGASSSLLATLEDGELTLQGLVTAVMDRLSGTDVPLPRVTLLWNLGTSGERVEGALETLGKAP